MFKKVLKGFLVLAACFAVTAVSAKEVKADEDVMFYMYDGSGNKIKTEVANTSGEPFFSATYSGPAVSQVRTCEFMQDGKRIQHMVKANINGHYVKSWKSDPTGPDGAGLYDKKSDKISIKAYYKDGNYIVEFFLESTERIAEAPKQEEKHEEKHEDLSAKAFGGRKADQLSVAEQKSAVSYALESLRAGGNALPAQAVTVNVGGKAQDIAAVVAEDRNATNQQMFAQVMATRLGFKKVTALKTYDMYALSASSTVKNNAQVIKWANTGLKAGDTAFVVWYNQKLGRTELLPAVVGVDGSVAVNVPALGDVSTMTIVKADK